MILDTILITTVVLLYLGGMSLMSDYIPMIRQLLAIKGIEMSKQLEWKLLLGWPYAVLADFLRGIHGR